MKSVREVLNASRSYLEGKGLSIPRRAVEEVFAHILKVDRIHLYAEFDRPLEEGELEQCRQALKRLSTHEPWQYIVGEIPFYGCTFCVKPGVLIPRQETEILVDKIAQALKKRGAETTPLTLWDLCTGSGCIGISLKEKFPLLKVVLSDVSGAALAIARENAQRNEVKVEIREGDLFAPFAGEKADFIVSNPPYISEAEYQTLNPEVKNFEPAQALVGGSTGLEFYQRIADACSNYLNPQGQLWMELGHKQGEPVKALFTGKGYENATWEPDWSGNDRFFNWTMDELD